MGLGKTVQAIAMLAARPKQAGLALVIAPTSVVDVWEKETKRFAPHLKIVGMHRGDRRHIYKQLNQLDIVVTSYALMRKDYQQLKRQTFDVVILDEAQAVKNYQGKMYSLVRQLPATRKFILTGTPMENNLMELWALASIAAPGLFSKPDHFREQFQRPIEKEQDKQVLTTLRARIKPFLLRRTKKQVATELPPKTIQTLTLDLHPKHRHMYDLHLQQERKKVLGLLAEGGLRTHRFEILKSITKMRQMALHPGLVDSKQEATPNVKIEGTISHIEELCGQGHRTLVFSQFTSFLKYVRAELDRRHIPYFYLDGSTKNRGELVEAFQDPTGNTQIFLLSLKAGGVGLTLTAADYCFILDPWWNPAVEHQAVDRTHRIGQDKHVHIYKMIGKGTIEEKVLALQHKKEKLFRDVIDGDGTFVQGVTEEDIRMLME